jgi:hypothetical protein
VKLTILEYQAMDAIKKSTGHISKDDIKRREKEVMFLFCQPPNGLYHKV